MSTNEIFPDFLNIKDLNILRGLLFIFLNINKKTNIYEIGLNEFLEDYF